MSRKKIDRQVHWVDPSKEAADHLNMTLDASEASEDLVVVDEKLKDVAMAVRQAGVPEALSESEALAQEIDGFLNPQDAIEVHEARTEEKVLEVQSTRLTARVLIFTKDESVLKEGSPTFTRITDLRHTFAEVHIVLLNMKSAEELSSTLRFFDTVWLYPTQSTSWWKLSLDAYRLAEKQLVFGGVFRADIIVAEDPFESGLAGLFLSKRFSRGVQLHLYEDYFDEAYMAGSEHPTLYTWAMHYVMRGVASVRTRTEFQRQATIAINPSLEEDAELLPNYYNLSAWRDFTPSLDLHERYPQFKFIILHVSSMRTSSHSNEVLLGVSPLLRRYPTIGLVVVGNGPLRTQLEKQAIALGLQNQIEFEPMPAEILSHLKSANVLVHLSDDGSEDDIILSGASVKVPLVVNKNGLAGKLFSDGVSARLCDPTDLTCVTESVNMYLNDNHARTQYSLRAYDTVFERVEQDYGGYLKAYADSIERSIQKES